MLKVDKIDTPTWHAVVIVIGASDNPTIRCIGFKRARDRDKWLGWFTASVGALADAVPTTF
jgi:hypothetical protein